MGNCVSLSVPLDQSVSNTSQWLGEKSGYIHDLKKNLLALEKTMEDLMAKKDTLLRRLRIEEDKGLERLAEIQVWLNRVDDIENTVKSIFDDRDIQIQRLCFCGFCSMSLLSSYRYGESVVLTLGKLQELKSEVFEVIAEQPQTSKVEEIQLPSVIVGQETMLDKAWNHFMKDEVSIMGMHGMGGVGKTTLLTQINNKLSNERCGFNYVIWVVVSQELQMERIQSEIAKKVGLREKQWNQKERSQKSIVLYNFLKNKRFVLLLDDIWQKVELEMIGVPNPTKQNKCKVVFTTRSQEVCGHMRVDESVEVQCLTEKEAYDLFQKKVGKKTLGSDLGIPDLARKVAKKCCGLPLALNIIGETMSCKTTIQEWHHAIYVLNSYASDFSGMGDKILPLLKYSYDDLKDEHVQSCLLYCALFPEDAKIPKEKLIDYCAWEWKIDGIESIKRAENKGYEIIGRLVRSSLLMEEVDHHGIKFVHMHDVVREMALWVASDQGIQKEAFIVRAGVGLDRMPVVEDWSVVRRMSLMDNNFRHLDGSPKCMELTTLLLQNIDLENISGEFFKFMPKLAILDLSGNRDLKFLDGISELVSLQYLNISRTNIRQLPKGLQELKKLIHLDMEQTYLFNISGISRVRYLKVLKLSGNSISWDLNTMQELENLEYLEILTIKIEGSLDSEQLLRSHRLISRTQNLSMLYYSSESSGISLPVFMDKLRVFYISNCSISEISMGRTCSFLSLVSVHIDGCRNLRELTFLMFAPNLQRLCVENADQLEDIINKEKACEVGDSGIVPFQKLTDLRLYYLPKLKDINWSHLPFSCLQTNEVSECENHPLSGRRSCSFLSLVRVDIDRCHSLRELTFLMFAPNLQRLSVEMAKQLEDIINKEKACEVGDSGFVPFQNLTNLNLYNLRKLKNIYWSPLPFPCLETIHVKNCENLKKLPVNSTSGRQGENGPFTIYAEKEWIYSLKWEDDATKSRILKSWLRKQAIPELVRVAKLVQRRVMRLYTPKKKQ